MSVETGWFDDRRNVLRALSTHTNPICLLFLNLPQIIQSTLHQILSGPAISSILWLAGKPHSKPDRQALALLIDLTQLLVGNLTNLDSEEIVPIVSANAQRANAEVKIDNSIENRHSYILPPGYWKGLASSSNFLGWKFERCLTALHEEITDSWNFNDPANLLNGPEFVDNIKILTQLVTPDDTEAKSLFGNVEGYEGLIGIGTTVVGAAAGPAVAAIGLSVFFTQWIAKAYDTTPAALRCFMGYIIDLILVLDQLFLVGLSTNVPRPLTPEDITEAIENHKRLHMANVHREIRQYVHSATFKDILRWNKAESKVKELLKKYCAKGTSVSGNQVNNSLVWGAESRAGAITACKTKLLESGHEQREISTGTGRPERWAMGAQAIRIAFAFGVAGPDGRGVETLYTAGWKATPSAA
ncbi:hypothetical protein K438DRAFT_2074921 [Mycena galopus ATCC 62051]|nr:hypothetical protein K438DRAFT_2074921 [Mycena galopus ATCC 62051]